MMRRREFLAGGLVGAGAWTSGCGKRPKPRSSEEPRIVRLDEGDGVSWLLDADHDRFFVVGTSLPQAAHYAEETPEAVEGMARVLDELERQGFNTLDGTGTTPSTLFRERVHFVSRPEGLSADSLPVALDRPNEFHPDLFDPTYYGDARWMGRLAAYYGFGAETVVGYTLGESPDWRQPLDGAMHPWVGAMRALDDGTPGKRRWVEGLRDRYELAGEASAVYGVTDATWEALARRTEWPEVVDRAAARADGEALLRSVAERWYQTRTEGVRGFDRRGTLVLSDRIDVETMPGWLCPIVSKYADVLYLECRLTDEAASDRLAAIFKATGKPQLIVGAATDPGIYAAELQRVASLPYVVGRIELGDLDRADARVAEANRLAPDRHDASAERLP